MDRRILTVEVVRAKGLAGMNKRTGNSDPFVVVQLEGIGGQSIRKEKFQTKVVNKTLQPEWNEIFSLGQTYDLDTMDDLPSLVLHVMHQGGYMLTDESMGKVTIPLDTINPSGKEEQGWYPLVGDARLKFQASGELMVKIKFSRRATGDEGEDMDEESGLLEADSGEFSDQEPNELIVTVVQGKNLPIMDRNVFNKNGGSSDPFVEIKIENNDTKKSRIIKRNINPRWDSKLVWTHLEDSSLALEVTVKDYNDVMANAFMGRAIIPLADFHDKKPVKKWYSLYDKEGESDGVDRGKIELLIHWVFNVKLLTEKKKGAKFTPGSGVRSMIGGAQALVRGELLGGESDEEDDGAEPADAEEAPQETAAEAEEKKKADEERMKALGDIEVKSGDYQLQVHIIECRDLKGENMDGTSDPVVYVETFKQKQNTSVQYSCTSCVFDELLIFDLKGLEKEEFEEGLIRISCYDSNTVGRNVMIGAWACDATMVYFQKDHEYYRKWIPLMDDEDADDVGVQGYMKMSIQIIGPGEKMKVHDEDAEKREEMQKEAACGGDIGSMVLTPPNVRKEWVYMVATIYKCEALTVMDGAVKGLGVTVNKAGTDAFIGASFGGAKEVKTRVKTCKGTRQAMNPEFNYELWYPVAIPTMTQLMKLCVYDDDMAGKELIGQCFEKYSVVDKLPGKSTPVKYINLYGAPEDKSGGLLKNAAKAAKAAKAAAEHLGGGIDYKDLYNNVAEKGSTYKGKMLCRFQIKTKRPEKYDTEEVKPFRRKIPRLTPKQMPIQTEYCLQALVVSGSDLPAFTPLSVTAVGGKKQELRVKVTIGHHELCTNARPFNNGVVSWQQEMNSGGIKLPVALDQLPDIIVYLIREDNTPVCFSRIKPWTIDPETKAKVPLGYIHAAKWILLQEDKVLDCLDDGEFPGSVLVKLGFGLMEDAKKPEVVSHWRKSVQDMKTKEPHQVRVHIYQGKELEAADSNGLSDPYVKTSFMGIEPKKTKVKKETLFPSYYETQIFNVELPLLEYAPQVNFKVYDKDISTLVGDGDYLGCCTYDLNNSVETPHDQVETAVLPDPMWLSLYKELPGDGQGYLMVLVQIIKKTSPAQVLPAPLPNAIVPPTRKAFIEIITVGCRDMAPYNFLPMQYPFLEFQLDAFGKKVKIATPPSKRPNPSNPNYLERIIMEVELPEKAIFASPLSLRARDTRLGGFLKPEVGVGTIPIVQKIPWWPNDEPLDDTPFPPTYVAPQSQVFCATPKDVSAAPGSAPGVGGSGGNGGDIEMLDETGKKVKKLEDERRGLLEGDDFVSTLEAPNVDDFVNSRMATEETGAGVFGALRHINMKGNVKKTGIADAFTDPDWSQDDSDQPPEWSIGRKTLPAELEDHFKTTPFETYNLSRGQENGLMGNTFKIVGKFKGLVRVMKNADDPPLFPQEILDDLFKPKLYKVRLYCLRGVGLAKMDIGITGKPESSDPYLICKLGKFKFNDRKNAVDDATDVDFYKMVDVDAELPGTSQLRIDVMDKDLIGSDDLIGRTVIDLEDRWFDGRWQEWGRENRITEAGDNGKVRFDTKPVEVRSLYLPGKASPQGALTCWVDIMKPEESSFFLPDDVALPPVQIFELRVVIWKSKNVPAMDSLEGMSDLYIKAWPEGCDPLETDTHWRCKKGKASWNWRLLFDVELGHSTRAMKFPFFHVQMWDRDLLKYNDCAGEVHINLEKYYRKAYKRNIALKLFEKKKGAAAKRAKKMANDKSIPEIEENDDDLPPAETDEHLAEADAATLAASKNPMLNGGGTASKSMAMNRGGDSDDDEDDHHMHNGGDSDDDEDMGVGAIPRGSMSGNKLIDSKTTTSSSDVKPTKEESSGGGWWFGGGGEKKKEEEKKGLLEEDEESDDDEPLDEEDKAKEQEEEELNDMITTIKGMTGLYEDDPEDSEWLHFEKVDHNNPGKPESMGYVCYSIQLWPKDKAVVMAVGGGRNEPNSDPYLPPPVGRLQFSLNPFVMGSQLCGPKLCGYLTCCIICAGFLALMIFCQPFLNIIINIVFLMA